MRKTIQRQVLNLNGSPWIKGSVLLLAVGLFVVMALHVSQKMQTSHTASLDQLVSTFKHDPSLVAKAINQAFVSTQLTYTLDSKDLWDM